MQTETIIASHFSDLFICYNNVMQTIFIFSVNIDRNIYLFVIELYIFCKYCLQYLIVILNY